MAKNRMVLKAKVDTGAGFHQLILTSHEKSAIRVPLISLKNGISEYICNTKKAIEAAHVFEEALVGHEEETGIVNTHVITSSTGITLRIANWNFFVQNWW